MPDLLFWISITTTPLCRCQKNIPKNLWYSFTTFFSKKKLPWRSFINNKTFFSSLRIETRSAATPSCHQIFIFRPNVLRKEIQSQYVFSSKLPSLVASSDVVPESFILLVNRNGRALDHEGVCSVPTRTRLFLTYHRIFINFCFFWTKLFETARKFISCFWSFPIFFVWRTFKMETFGQNGLVWIEYWESPKRNRKSPLFWNFIFTIIFYEFYRKKKQTSL